VRYGLDVGGALCAFADYLCELFRNMNALQREICLTFWEFVIDTERATQIQNTNQLKPSNSVHFHALGTCNAFQTCPNESASQAGYDVSKAVKERTPCFYDHLWTGKKCGGYGHRAGHIARADGTNSLSNYFKSIERNL
jgi:hypothetical protein